MKSLLFFLLIVIFISCVSKKKYNGIIFDIDSKNKSIAKLEKELEKQKNINIVLSDSLERIK